MSLECGLTKDHVEDLLSRAKRKEGGKYSAEVNESDSLTIRTECDIKEPTWVSMEEGTDPSKAFKAARAVEDGEEDDGDIFLRIGGVVTTAGLDDNGVMLTPAALKSIPADFKKRTTLLFNHDSEVPIGRIVNSKVIRKSGSAPARATIVADVHKSAINEKTDLPYAELIRSGILSKYSFAWGVIRGEIIFDFSQEIRDYDEDTEIYTVKIGSKYAPEINMYEIRATEASVVSVPADSAADLTAGQRFARSLGEVSGNWGESPSGVLRPLRSVKTIDRPFNSVLAKERVKNWAASGDSLDLSRDEDFAKFAQAFAGHSGEGSNESDWFGLHCDVVEGELAWNKRAISQCLSEFDSGEHSAERARLCRELSIVHGVEVS